MIDGAVVLYSSRRNGRAADLLADEMRAEGTHVLRCSTKMYRGEVHTHAPMVLHDGSAPMLVAVHEGTDVKVCRWDEDIEVELATPVDVAPQDAEIPDGGATEADLNPGSPEGEPGVITGLGPEFDAVVMDLTPEAEA